MIVLEKPCYKENAMETTTMKTLKTLTRHAILF